MGHKEIIDSLSLGMVTLSIQEEEEVEEGVEEEEKCQVEDLMRGTQPDGLEEAPLEGGEMVKDFIPLGPLERNESYSQVEEWSDPASEGRRRSYILIYSPTTHRTPPTPAPLEDRLFTDWSSIGSRSPPVIPPPQSVPRGGTLITSGIEDICETEQVALQPSQPIS